LAKAKDTIVDSSARADEHHSCFKPAPEVRDIAVWWDEVANLAALLMGPDGGFITGSDILMDGGVTATYWYGDLAEVRGQN
jgi:hypothetical protein